MPYRPEINGLRAIAVLSVIYYHFGLPELPGGFIGVDVFFVISGYLISSLLFKEISSNSFKFKQFFVRRAGRLLPNLFTVILVTIPVAWLTLDHAQMVKFGWSVIGSASFTSNIVFGVQSSYFENTEIRPLLHTWSLGVEEQFYLVIPVLLLFLFKLTKTPNSWFWGLAIITVSSFLSTFWFSTQLPEWNYYLLITRMWELGVGGIAAYLIHQKLIRPDGLRISTTNGLSIIGFILIIASLFCLNEGYSYPGILTVFPILGTTLILLFANKVTLIGKFLSLKIFIWIGLISYSLYLWHQPVFSFINMLEYSEKISLPRPLLILLALVTTLVLSILAYQIVENPFRKLSHTKSSLHQSKILLFGVLASLVIIGVGFSLVMLPQNTKSPTGLTSISTRTSNQFVLNPVGEICPFFEDIPGQKTCSKYGNGSKNIVIWGDSHAKMMSTAIPTFLFESTEYSLYVISTYGCPPISGVIRADNIGNASNCDSFEELTNELDYINSLSPKDVIMAARWTMYLDGWKELDQLLPETHFLNDHVNIGNDKKTSKRVTNTQAINTINQLVSEKVFVIAQSPELQSIPKSERESESWVKSDLIEPNHISEKSFLRQLGLHSKATIVSTRSAFCDGQKCRLEDSRGNKFFIDDNHLTPQGAELVWSKLVNSGLTL